MSWPARIAIDARHIGQYGIGRYIQELIAALTEVEGDETFLIITQPQRADMVPRHDRVSIVHDATGIYSGRGIASVGRNARAHGADLVHATHYVVPLTKLPVVTTIHDLIHLRLSRQHINGMKRLYAHWMLARAARKSRRIITPTEAVRQEIIERYRVDPERIHPIHHGIDPIRFSPDPNERSREPFILYAGNDRPHKNLGRLIEAFTRVRERIAPVQLVLAGKTFDRFTGVPGVRIEGHVTDDALVDLYRRATACVLPSIFEGFGIPVVEAMGCGTPVLASDIPALREVAADSAVFFDPLSVVSMAEAIAMMVSDRPLRDRLTLAGRERAEVFRWRTTAARTLAVYRQALAR